MLVFRIVAALIAMLTSAWTPAKAQQIREPAASFAGTFKKADFKRSILYLEMSDGNTMELRLTRKTRVKAKGDNTLKLEDLEDGDTVEIEGRRILREVVAESVLVTVRAKEKK